MKIVHFSHCNLGSAEASTAHVMEFAERLAQKGHQVWVAAPKKGIYSQPTQCRMRYFPYINLKGLRQPTAILTGFLTLLVLYFTRGIDCVYIRRLTVDPMPGVFSRLTGVPLIVETNGQVEVHEHEFPLHFLWLSFWLPLMLAFERILFGAAHAVTADGEGRLAAFKKRYPRWKSKFHMVRSGGIDMEKFRRVNQDQAREKHGLPPDRRILVWVGTIFAFSGVETLMEAAGTVCRRFDDVDFLLIGDGPKRNHFMKMAAEMGLADRFTFTGYIATAQLYSWLSASDMALAPYNRLRLSREDFTSYKIFEYLACGLPVVCSYEPGGRSNIAYVPQYNLGVTVEPENGPALAQGIATALETPEFFKAGFRQRARDILDSLDLTWDALADQVEDLCLAAAGGKK